MIVALFNFFFFFFFGGGACGKSKFVFASVLLLFSFGTWGFFALGLESLFVC